MPGCFHLVHLCEVFQYAHYVCKVKTRMEPLSTNQSHMGQSENSTILNDKLTDLSNQYICDQK